MNQLASPVSRYRFYALSMLMALAALLGAIAVYVDAQQRFDEADGAHHHSVLLADEFRESSDDLTRMARTYVVTGDAEFRRQFMDVLAIRDGLLPRPANYGPSYWDFMGIERRGSSRTSDAPIALLELVRQAGFTVAELEKLAESKQRSDALVKLELEAMALIAEGMPSAEQKALAIDMLHHETFRRAKADIMRPLLEFDQMVRERTTAAVAEARQRIKWARVAVIALAMLLLVLIWRLSRQLYVILGCSVPELQRTIARMGDGNFAPEHQPAAVARNSVLGWLVQSQERLQRMELQHFKAIVASSDDAIISKTTLGVITSWNPGAESLFGYSTSEAMGQPIQMLIPADRQNEEPTILACISQEERVRHYETQRLRKDGSLVEVSCTVSPIVDDDGRVVGASTIARDITRAKAAEREIHRLAYYDPLTGLPNRRLLRDRLQQAHACARRLGTLQALVFIDLDNFKRLNDSHGHEVGDLLLTQVARRLEDCVSETDTVARLGGDEFVVILHGSGTQVAQVADHPEALGAKMLEVLGEPYDLKGQIYHCTPSLGMAMFDNAEASIDELLRRADHAMYQAKQAGRNTLCVYNLEAKAAAEGETTLASKVG